MGRLLAITAAVVALLGGAAHAAEPLGTTVTLQNGPPILSDGHRYVVWTSAGRRLAIRDTRMGSIRFVQKWAYDDDAWVVHTRKEIVIAVTRTWSPDGSTYQLRAIPRD